ncbi:MAG: FAD-dependent oxidoreductase [Deltaproteobacteria bacterium]
MAIVDVTVRGAGVFGLSIAYACARRGANVRVVDPFGAGSGASGGIVGALAPHTPDQWNAKKQFQFEALVMGEGFWAGVAEASGNATGYARTGRVQVISAAGVELAKARIEAARLNWRGQAEWRVDGLEVHDTLSALIHPRQAMACLAGLVDVVTDAPDEGAVVHATGWRGLVDNDWGNGVKGQAVLLGFDGAGGPQRFVDGLHIIPHLDETTAIGSTSERSFDDPVATDDQCDQLIAKAVAMMPELEGAKVLERWAGVRPRATSRAPLLGAWPGRQGHFIANGGFKIGFGIAPKVAEVMADLVLEGRDQIPDDFKPPA